MLQYMTKSSSHSKNISSVEETLNLAKNLIPRLKTFKYEAYRILATHETSKNRIITIEKTYSQITNLSLKQNKLLREAINCVEYRFFRAAHVLSWAAFMDFIDDKLGEDGFKKVKNVRPNWNINTVEDLRDIGSDYQIIETLKKVGLCGRVVEKGLKGLLSKRNECAHPSDYEPELNETLGYISELLKRVKYFNKKNL